jgi:hypothetical protein
MSRGKLHQLHHRRLFSFSLVRIPRTTSSIVDRRTTTKIKG